MLSHSLKKLDPFLAISFLFRPDYQSFHFNYLLNSCSSLSQLKRIHALILTNGAHHHHQISTKLISLAASFAPSMEYARNLFDKMPQRGVFHWNTLIRGYADLGPCQESVIAYREMHLSGVSPDAFTFPSLLRSCAVLSLLWEGKEVHCNVVKNGFCLDVFIQTSLVTMYAQNGVTFDSEIVFGEMGVKKNVVSWTALIAGYVQNGLLGKGLDAFHEMIASGTRPNAITLVSVLPACASSEFISLGKLIHGYGVKLGLDLDISLTNSLIAFYGKCGEVGIAQSLFDHMKVRSLVSWNAMIAAYEQNNAGAKSIKLFQRMLEEKIEFDYITLVSVISACASLGALNTGKWAHQLAKNNGFEFNVSVANALIDMYAKCGNINLARNVFDRLPHKSVVAWTSIIAAYASHGHGEEAVRLYSKMREEEIKPNNFTYTAVLTACRHSGFVEEGRKHFESMKKDYFLEPEIEQCSCMVDLLGRGGLLLEAFEFIENMPFEPDVDVWGALLSACKIHGNIELAELVADRLFRLNPGRISFYVLMVNIYAEAGRWEDVARWKKLMEEREMKRIPGQSLVEVNRKFHILPWKSGERNSVSTFQHTAQYIT